MSLPQVEHNSLLRGVGPRHTVVKALSSSISPGSSTRINNSISLLSPQLTPRTSRTPRSARHHGTGTTPLLAPLTGGKSSSAATPSLLGSAEKEMEKMKMQMKSDDTTPQQQQQQHPLLATLPHTSRAQLWHHDLLLEDSHSTSTANPSNNASATTSQPLPLSLSHHAHYIAEVWREARHFTRQQQERQRKEHAQQVEMRERRKMQIQQGQQEEEKREMNSERTPQLNRKRSSIGSPPLTSSAVAASLPPPAETLAAIDNLLDPQSVVHLAAAMALDQMTRKENTHVNGMRNATQKSLLDGDGGGSGEEKSSMTTSLNPSSSTTKFLSPSGSFTTTQTSHYTHSNNNNNNNNNTRSNASLFSGASMSSLQSGTASTARLRGQKSKHQMSSGMIDNSNGSNTHLDSWSSTLASLSHNLYLSKCRDLSLQPTNERRMKFLQRIYESIHAAGEKKLSLHAQGLSTESARAIVKLVREIQAQVMRMEEEREKRNDKREKEIAAAVSTPSSSSSSSSFYSQQQSTRYYNRMMSNMSDISDTDVNGDHDDTTLEENGTDSRDKPISHTHATTTYDSTTNSSSTSRGADVMNDAQTQEFLKRSWESAQATAPNSVAAQSASSSQQLQKQKPLAGGQDGVTASEQRRDEGEQKNAQKDESKHEDGDEDQDEDEGATEGEEEDDEEEHEAQDKKPDSAASTSETNGNTNSKQVSEYITNLHNNNSSSSSSSSLQPSSSKKVIHSDGSTTDLLLQPSSSKASLTSSRATRSGSLKSSSSSSVTNLNNNNISSPSSTFNPLHPFTSLDLTGNNLGDRGALEMAALFVLPLSASNKNGKSGQQGQQQKNQKGQQQQSVRSLTTTLNSDGDSKPIDTLYPLSRLTTLILRSNNLSSLGFSYIFDSLAHEAAPLINLDMSAISVAAASTGAGMIAGSVSALASNLSTTSSPLLTNSGSIGLGNMFIGLEGCHSLGLLLSHNTRLRSLSLQNVSVGTVHQGLDMIARGLVKNTTLEYLDLSSNRIVFSQDFTSFITALKDTHVATLNMSYNPLDNLGGNAIAGYISCSKHISKLLLTSCSLTIPSLALITQAMEMNETLHELRLEENCFRDAHTTGGGGGGSGSSAAAASVILHSPSSSPSNDYTNPHAYLQKILFHHSLIGMNISPVFTHNLSLHVLSLSSCSIDDRVIVELAKTLEGHATLHTLELRRNKISSPGAKAIAALLKENPILDTIDLYMNFIEDEGGVELARACKENRSLTELNLGNNKLTSTTAAHFISALSPSNNVSSSSIPCSPLLHISLDGNAVDYRTFCTFQELIKQNRARENREQSYKKRQYKLLHQLQSSSFHYHSILAQRDTAYRQDYTSLEYHSTLVAGLKVNQLNELRITEELQSELNRLKMETLEHQSTLRNTNALVSNETQKRDTKLHELNTQYQAERGQTAMMRKKLKKSSTTSKVVGLTSPVVAGMQTEELLLTPPISVGEKKSPPNDIERTNIETILRMESKKLEYARSESATLRSDLDTFLQQLESRAAQLRQARRSSMKSNNSSIAASVASNATATATRRGSTVVSSAGSTTSEHSSISSLSSQKPATSSRSIASSRRGSGGRKEKDRQ